MVEKKLWDAFNLIWNLRWRFQNGLYISAYNSKCIICTHKNLNDAELFPSESCENLDYVLNYYVVLCSKIQDMQTRIKSFWNE